MKEKEAERKREEVSMRESEAEWRRLEPKIQRRHAEKQREEWESATEDEKKHSFVVLPFY